MSNNEMMRFNKGKVDLTHLSWLAQYIESLIFMYGEIKYARDNWKKGKPTLGETMLNLMQSTMRHISGLQRGEWLDPESKMPHAGHAVWNLNRMIDFHYLGTGDDSINLLHNPLVTPLPEVPQLETFYDVYGVVPQRLKGTKDDPTIKEAD